MAVSITECYKISCGAAGKEAPWIVNTIEVIDGVKFIHLDKRNCGLSRFVTGSNTGLRVCAWLEEARGLRTTAHLVDALAEGIPLFGLKVLSQYQIRKKLKHPNYADAQKSNVLVVPYPKVVSSEGEEVAAAIDMHIKNTSSFKDGLTVKFDAVTLAYIRQALIHGPRNTIVRQSDETVADDKDIKWNKKRKAYIATLPSPDSKGRKYRTVKPASADEDDKMKALDKARALIDGTYVSEDEGSAAAEPDEPDLGDSADDA